MSEKNCTYLCDYCKKEIQFKHPLWFVADGVTHDGECTEKMDLYLKGDPAATAERQKNFDEYYSRQEK